LLIADWVVNYPHAILTVVGKRISRLQDCPDAGAEVDAMDWTPWLPLITGIITGGLTGGIALLGIWGSIQHRLGRLEARIDNLERLYEEARAENIRLHEETRAEIRREIRLVLQVLREHTHSDGSPAATPIPVDGN
jgi:hypothetical protein